MSAKRPPSSATDPTPSKRVRLTSTETPSPSPEPATLPTDQPGEPADRPPHHDTSEKYLGGVASVAGTRRGDGTDFHPADEEEEHDPPAEEGSRRPREEDLNEPPKTEETIQREKDEEARLIDEAAKGVSIDDSELGDAKEVSSTLLPFADVLSSPPPPLASSRP